jgi:exodeoxyribonuclease VII small subunit
MSTNSSHSSKASTKKPPAPSYADLQAELDQILVELQRDDLDVDDALRYYQQGVVLVGQLEQYLKTAQNKIAELQAKSGNPTA